MLPFLEHKKTGGALAATMKDGEVKMDSNADLVDIATELLSAIAAKDSKAVADALEAAFAVCDSMPHEEGPHIEEEV